MRNRRKIFFRVMIGLVISILIWPGCAPRPQKQEGVTRVFERQTLRPVPFPVFLHNAFELGTADKVIKPALAAQALTAGETVVVIAEKDRFVHRPGLSDIEQLACEDGIIGALTGNGFPCFEKTYVLDIEREPDTVKIKNVPDIQGIHYVSPLTPEDINRLKEASVSKIIQYRIVSTTETEAIEMSFYNILRDFIVYYRIIDVNSGTITWSDTVRVSTEPALEQEALTQDGLDELEAFRQQADPLRILDVFNLTREIVGAAMPEKLLRSLDHAAVINEGYLQLADGYKIKGGVVVIEDALIASLAAYSSKAVAEKFTPIQIKHSWQYDNMVFYMNPLCYLNWDEIIRKHMFKQLLLYRVIDSKTQGEDVPARFAIFMKLIDLEKGGRVIWAGLAHGEDPEWEAKAAKLGINVFDEEINQRRWDRVPQEEDAVEAASNLFGKFLDGLQEGLLKEGDQILLLNTQSVAVDHKYTSADPMDMAAEDGIVTALVAQGYGVVEKLASIYINPEWKYKDKAFYINPLFLRKLDMLFKYSGSKVSKIIAYKKIELSKKTESTSLFGPTFGEPELAGMYIRIIDVGEGTIVYSGVVESNTETE